MKEDLVDYDSNTRLFREREAFNLKVRLNATERHFYDAWQDIANTYFPSRSSLVCSVRATVTGRPSHGRYGNVI